MTKKSRLVAVALLGLVNLVGSLSASAQTNLKLPDSSQAAETKQRVGVTDVTITYNRPLVNGRKIWGGLVPMGEVWRAGANENTAIAFSTPVSIEGKPLPAGRYGLHMIPAQDQWTIIFSKMADAWGSYTYDEKEDALRVTVKPRENEMEEALEYEFEDLKSDAATILFKWEKLAVPIRVSVTDADAVFPTIRADLRGHHKWDWQAQMEAARYALGKKTNLDEALAWANNSLQLEERFENLSTKADVLKALNKADEAKTVWTRALEISSPIQLYSYARQLQGRKQDAEAMEIMQAVAKRSPDNVFGLLAQARLKSAAGDFDAALAAAKKAQTASPSEDQKKNIQNLITRLEAKQDINK